MSGAAPGPLMLGHAPVGTPLPRREDRWLGSAGSKAGRITAATLLILLGSVAFHGGIVATAFLADPTDLVEPEREIAVDLVPEEPKPTEEAKAAEAEPPPVKVAEAKPPERKPPEPKPPEGKPPEAKADAKPPEPKPPEVKPPEPPVKTAEAPAAAKPAPQPPAQSAPAQEEAELKALQDELAALKAERTAAQEKPTAAAAPKLRDAPLAGFGPLPGSFQAVALPSGSDDGEAVSYSALVFSQLAKAKGIGRREGKPGTAGVRFDVADDGALTDVELVTSSGIKSLDDEAIAIVRKAAPFPAPPAGAQRNFTANVSFITDASR